MQWETHRQRYKRVVRAGGTPEKEHWRKSKIGTQIRAGGKAATPEQRVRRLRRKCDCKGTAPDGGTHITAREQNLHWALTAALTLTKVTGYNMGRQEVGRKGVFLIFVYLILIYFSELETKNLLMGD